MSMALLWSTILSIGVCTGHPPVTPCSPSETANELAASFNLSGKVAIVTGGDSGLGYAVSESLARQGATVVIAGHSASKCEIAADTLRNTTRSHVWALPLDLASFANVRAFAQKFLKSFDKLDYLINNAGISHALGSGEKTEDGFEQVFQVNYLGHFLLTELLLPALRKAGSSRVVHVASVAHTQACQMAGFPADCAKDFTYIPPPVMEPNKSIYGFSKLMMIEHVAELERREVASGSGVSAYSLCPGLVVTGMTKENPEIFKMCSLNPWFQKPCPYNPQQGAAVIAYAALKDLEPGLWYERRTGCVAGSIVTSGFTDAMRSELYTRSQKMVGLNPSERIVV